MKGLDDLNNPRLKIEPFVPSLSIKTHPKSIVFERQKHLITVRDLRDLSLVDSVTEQSLCLTKTGIKSAISAKTPRVEWSLVSPGHS